MSYFEVKRGSNLMKQTPDHSEALKAFRELNRRHPNQAICLIKVDVLQSNPAQQAFNQKREQKR